jgi:hypothetical protein
MGLITDFCIAPLEDADALALMSPALPQAYFPYARMYGWKGLDQLKLDQLFQLANSELQEPASKLASQPPVATQADGAIMIFNVDLRLFATLSALNKKQRAAIAERLLLIEEWRQDGWSSTDALKLMDEFTKFSKMAQKASSTVLLYMSL